MPSDLGNPIGRVMLRMLEPFLPAFAAGTICQSISREFQIPSEDAPIHRVWGVRISPADNFGG